MPDVTESGSLAGSVEGPAGSGPDVTTKSEACELAPAAREVGCLHSTTTASQATGSDRLESGVVASMSSVRHEAWSSEGRVGVQENLFSLQRSEGQVESSSRGRKLIPMAEDLAIAGLVPLSSVDWPDHLVATVFCQGCPWRCPYCQNAAILDPRTPGILPWLDVEELLVRRRGLLDGVVFTGGEALRQAAIVPAMERVREFGLGVGLHTAGAYPHRLAEVLDLVDWVGLDIKAEPGDYREAAGFAAGMKAWDSLKLVLAEARARGGVGCTADYVGTVDLAGPAAADVAGAGIEAIDNAGATAARPFTYEIRLTVFPGAPAERNFSSFLARLREVGVEHFALQEARTQGADEIFQAMAQRWDKVRWRSRFEEMVAEARVAGFTTVEVR